MKNKTKFQQKNTALLSGIDLYLVQAKIIFSHAQMNLKFLGEQHRLPPSHQL